jgi:hypothetical protein
MGLIQLCHVSSQTRKSPCQRGPFYTDLNRLMTLFYFPPNFPCQLTRPRFPVPRGTPKTPDYVLEPGHIMLPVSQTFTAACQFWTIMHQVVLNGDLDPAVPAEWQKVLRTSEWKFRKLLTWADNLPPGLLRSRECSNHVMVFQ